MKKYCFFGIVALISIGLLINKASAEEEPVHNIKHTGHEHSPHKNPDDAFGGYYKSSGADCGGGWILCPASSPHSGYHTALGDWNFMTHGLINFAYTVQPGPRGESGFAAPNHFMIMGERGGIFGGNFRLGLGMSFDVFTESVYGKSQLLQTGELYHGRENVDVQHRHPLITNLSATYAHPFSLSENSDWFCEAALVGDVSGVPMEFHRTSARRFVDVSLFHHGTTDKHIASSVFLCGADIEKIRIAAATFHGQEPGSNPYSLSIGAPDSFAASLQYLPTRNWAFSLYYANIHNAERNEPGDIKRVSAAAMYTLPLDNGDWWATTLAVTHDEKTFGNATNVLVVDSTLKRGKNYFYGRIDAGQKPASLLETNSFGRHGLDLSSPNEAQNEKNVLIGAGTLGYARTLWQSGNAEFGAGADITGYVLPNEAKEVYGSFPVSANMYLFVNF